MKYKDWYNSEILNKIKKIGYDCENKRHYVIDYDDPFDYDDPDGEYVSIPTPREFIEWLLDKGEYFIAVSPEPNYDFGYVFTYNVWELSDDNHYDLRLYKTNFRTHQEAYEQAAYDLLMKMTTDSNGKI
jgi:hypothetical protein